MTEANELALAITPQMPVIIAPQSGNHWLETGSSGTARDMLRPDPAAKMRAFRVSGQVSDKPSNGPGLIAPLN